MVYFGPCSFWENFQHELLVVKQCAKSHKLGAALSCLSRAGEKILVIIPAEYICCFCLFSLRPFHSNARRRRFPCTALAFSQRRSFLIASKNKKSDPQAAGRTKTRENEWTNGWLFYLLKKIISSSERVRETWLAILARVEQSRRFSNVLCRWFKKMKQFYFLDKIS